jgi:hypothetical protein
VIFWRLAGGEEDELLALRVLLLLDLVAIFEEAKMIGGLCRWPPNTFWMEMDNDGRRIDAKFNSNSTRHHSNTLHCRAQGQWQRPHNPPQHLLSFLSFLHDCFIPKLPRIHSQIQPAHSERKQDLTPTNQNTRSKPR